MFSAFEHCLKAAMQSRRRGSTYVVAQSDFLGLQEFVRFLLLKGLQHVAVDFLACPVPRSNSRLFVGLPCMSVVFHGADLLPNPFRSFCAPVSAYFPS